MTERTIPEDVMAEASRVLRLLDEPPSMGKLYLVARALATERERCARIVEEFERANDGCSLAYTAPQIAAAIRGGSNG